MQSGFELPILNLTHQVLVEQAVKVIGTGRTIPPPSRAPILVVQVIGRMVNGRLIYR